MWMQIKLELDMPKGKANDCTNPKTSYLFCKVLGQAFVRRKVRILMVIPRVLKQSSCTNAQTKVQRLNQGANEVDAGICPRHHCRLPRKSVGSRGTTSAAYWDMVTCRVVTTKYGSTLKNNLFDRLRTRGKGITVYVNDVNIMGIKNTNRCFYGPSFSAWEGSKTNWHALRITVCLQDMCKMQRTII